MFTGIIEEVGSIAAIKQGENSSTLQIQANEVLQQTKLGDSIATNGVCLTVVKLHAGSFEADVMAETLRRSSLGSLAMGSKVNLERALLPTTRMGGHMVSGHIDGTGMITKLEREDNAVWVTIEAGPNIIRYIVEKGSIAIDGISLTVAVVEETYFKVSIIPHTGKETTLLQKKSGDVVNLECDIIGKYVEKMMGLQQKEEKKPKSRINEAFLELHGFY